MSHCARRRSRPRRRVTARWQIATLCGAALALAWPHPATAEQPLVSLHIDACPEAQEAVVRHIVQVELGDLLLAAEAARDAGTTRIEVTCSGSSASVRVVDGVTGKNLERQLELAAVAPEMQARLLGLAAAELVVASWVELSVEPATMPSGLSGLAGLSARAPLRARQVAAAFVEAREPRAALPERRWLARAAAAQLSFDTGLSLRGVELGAVYRQHEWLGYEATLGGYTGGQSVDNGRIITRALAAAVEVAACVTIDRLALEGAAGVRAGVARLRGIGAPGLDLTGLTFTAPWAGAHVGAEAQVRATDRLHLHVGVEAGAVVAGVAATVAGIEEPHIDGWWMRVWSGASIGF